MKNVIDFLVYFHDSYIIEDFTELSKIGKVFIYPAWILRSIFMWCISPLFIPKFALIRYLNNHSKVYREVIREMQKASF